MNICNDCYYSMELDCNCKRRLTTVVCVRYLNEDNFPDVPLEVNKESNCNKFENRTEKLKSIRCQK